MIGLNSFLNQKGEMLKYRHIAHCCTSLISQKPQGLDSSAWSLCLRAQVWEFLEMTIAFGLTRTRVGPSVPNFDIVSDSVC